MTAEGPRVQPSLIVALAILVGWLLDWWLDPVALPREARTAGAPTILLGLGLVAWAIVVQVRSGNNPEIHRPTTRLVVEGPYKFTRNPIYLGFLVAQVGIGLVLAWPIAALVPVSAYLLHIWVVLPEEKQLRALFAEYEAYCTQVRRWV